MSQKTSIRRPFFLLGLCAGVLSEIAYGTNGLFVLPLCDPRYGRGFSVEAVLVIRYALAALILGLGLPLLGRPLAVRKREIGLLLASGALFSLSSLTLYASYPLLGVGLASTLLFVYPVMVAAMMAALGEKPGTGTLLGIVLALAGVAILGIDGDGKSSLLGFLLIFLSALTIAVYMVLVRVSALKDIPGDRICFYNLLTGIPLYIALLSFRGGIPSALSALRTIDATGVACLVLVAIVPTIISIAGMAVSIQYLGAIPAAILGALEPLTAVVIGILVFGEPLTLRLILGFALILASVLLTVIPAKRLSP